MSDAVAAFWGTATPDWVLVVASEDGGAVGETGSGIAACCCGVTVCCCGIAACCCCGGWTLELLVSAAMRAAAALPLLLLAATWLRAVLAVFTGAGVLTSAARKLLGSCVAAFAAFAAWGDGGIAAGTLAGMLASGAVAAC